MSIQSCCLFFLRHDFLGRKFLKISSSSSSVIALVFKIEDDDEASDQDNGDEEAFFSFVSSVSQFVFGTDVELESAVGVLGVDVIDSLCVYEEIELLKPLVSQSL